MSKPEEIAERIYRLGTDWVNWYLCDAEGGLVIVDTGFRSYGRELPAALGHLGRSAEDVAAVVLTHYHPDHAGSAEWLRVLTGATVYAPVGDADGLRTGKVPVPGGLLASLWRPAMARYAAHIIVSGGMRRVRIGELTPYGDGDVLDLPLPLRAIATPGHTGGHSALAADDRGVLFTGDALANVNFFTRQEGVQVLPFNEDLDAAVRSRARLEGESAATIAFGHGRPVSRA